MLICIFVLSGCGFEDKGDFLSSVKIQETDLTEVRYSKSFG